MQSGKETADGDVSNRPEMKRGESEKRCKGTKAVPCIVNRLR
jgi:hypothetical protein